MGIKRDYLMFVDTNIYLDFYRAQTDVGLKLLRRLESIPGKLISTYQVEMEFKKNRQKVLLGTIEQLKTPNRVSPPVFVSEYKYVKKINQEIRNTSDRITRLKKTIKRILSYPNTYDEVYKICKKIFNKEIEYTLYRLHEERFKIRRLARKRFFLGYPPRKDKDVSFGDAINWEWAIECCARNKKDLIIVSRDSDYGSIYAGESFINDWLLKEFRERVGTRRKIVLTNKLSKGLEILSIPISTQEQEEEQKLYSTAGALKIQFPELAFTPELLKNYFDTMAGVKKALSDMKINPYEVKRTNDET